MSLFGLPWDLFLIACLLAVFIPWRGVRRVRALLARPQLTPADRLSMYASTIAAQWFLGGITAWRCVLHGWSLPELGLALNRPARVFVLAAAITAGLAALQLMGIRQMARMPAENAGFLRELSRKLMPQNAMEIPVFFALVCTVSLCEEFLYRGFTYDLLFRVGAGSVFIAVLCSSALFAIGHLYQGRRGIISTFLLGLILAAARAWTGSLVPGFAAHFAVDLIAGLVAPRALRAAAQ
jgi:membrane protease YdiL (CAAX protease family)